MNTTRLFTTILLLLLTFGLVTAQEKKVEKKVVVTKEVHGIGEKDHDYFIIADEGGTDSLLQTVLIHKRGIPHHKVGRIIIKESGFFKKNKIIIDFDPMTKTIVKVVDNGEEVSPKKYHKYQDHLDDATEYAELEALMPQVEELELAIELGDLPDSHKLAELDKLIIELKGLESEHAVLKREHFASVRKVIELDNLVEVVKDVLAENGITPPAKIEDISIKDGRFFLNGEEIKGEVGKKLIEAYALEGDMKIEHLHGDGDESEIDVHIIFD